MTITQAVLFSKDMYDTTRARRWLMKHNIYPLKRVHITTNWLRYRIREPDYDHFEYRTKILTPGIKTIVAIPFVQMFN